jgi:hypothetical protein
VHLIPHTHDDVGWLKRVDDYYSGTEYNIQRAGVRYIIGTMIQQLLADSKKKFTYVEMKFFSMWFYEQTSELQDKVRNLVKNKQLEFVNAGWSMHDEACPTYKDMILNMQKGHDFLMKEFGFRPHVGW